MNDNGFTGTNPRSFEDGIEGKWRKGEESEIALNQEIANESSFSTPREQVQDVDALDQYG